jgi:LPXTG-motif cell wall-anchored protein
VHLTWPMGSTPDASEAAVHRRRKLLLAMVVTTLALAGTGVARAQAAPSVTASPAPVEQGGTLTVTLAGFEPSTPVSIAFPVPPVVEAAVDVDGALVLPVPIAAEVPAGTYPIGVTGTAPGGAPVTVSTTFTVVASSTTTTTAPAPTTTAPPTTSTTAPAAEAPSLTITPAEAAPGETLVFRGAGFAPDSLIVTWIGIPELPKAVLVDVDLVTDANGGFSFPVPLPDDAEPGVYVVVVEGEALDGEIVELQASFTVTGTSAGGGGVPGSVTPTTVAVARTVATLPRTGADGTTVSGLAAVGMLVAGAGMVLAARRRLDGVVPPFEV